MIALIKILLIPFSLIYSIIIELRNKFYDLGIFKSHKVSKPVISIGNITTGGTGKTPLTILTAEYFLKVGKKTGIISRGYKRSSAETVIVCDGESVNSNVENSGDELVLISEELMRNNKGSIFTIASSDRVSAAELMIQKFNPDIIILDDGFQHRKLERDLDIVIIDGTDFTGSKFSNSFTIPSGNLREPFSNIKRADIIIQNNKSENIPLQDSLLKYNNPVPVLIYETEYIMDDKNCILHENQNNVIVFSGIAKEDSFYKLLIKSNFIIKERVIFPDHHNYIQSDINTLAGKFDTGDIFITTEKDFVKVKRFKEFTERFPVYYLKLKPGFISGEEYFFNKINTLIN